MMPDPLAEEGIIGLSEVGSLMQNVGKINQGSDYEYSGRTPIGKEPIITDGIKWS